MLKFEQYLEQFNSTVNLPDFILGMLLTALLATGIRVFYIRFGEAISNRRRFANTFMPLALGTMLIITIVKSSLALSLGLVGALSIVRFRAAIKDPEELTYLFITIGLGLATGANQFLLALFAIPFILLLIWVHKKMNGKTGQKRENILFFNIQTDVEELSKITAVLSKTLPFIELKRMDTLEKGLDLSFICRAENLNQLETVSKDLKNLSAFTKLSVIEQPDLIV